MFDHFTEGRLLKEVVHEGKRPKLPRGLLPRLSALIEQCWHDDANERPGFDEILPQLNVLHVETAVEDPTGQEVWLCDELIDKVRVVPLHVLSICVVTMCASCVVRNAYLINFFLLEGGVDAV